MAVYKRSLIVWLYKLLIQFVKSNRYRGTAGQRKYTLSNYILMHRILGFICKPTILVIYVKWYDKKSVSFIKFD